MDYQWYPGHMTKAIRQMREDIKLVDLVIELLDARIPLSSRNPDIDSLGRNKSRLVILNKSDLADDTQNALWDKFFKDKGYTVLKVDSRVNSLAKIVDRAIEEACKEKIEANKKKGINRPIRAMVVGIPNVGKSTFINSYAKRSVAKTGNKPGVTKGKQWIKIGKNLELLDTPGILWPKFDDEQIGLNLALVGSMNDNILDAAELAFQFIKKTRENYPDILKNRFNIEGNEDVVEEMYQVADVRNCKLPGNKLDLDKASKIILDEFRSGKLGKITLDRL
ncbi:MAG TPA: ribosome biogenesis GTPase YlqF [Eubacterium sp.]|nr:ribosome biogenesis GTPase YlqF [Eubacterium sp.]